MGFRKSTYSLQLQCCCITYATVDALSISVLKPCEFFLESKNFHSEPGGVFFRMTCLFFLTCSMLLSICFRLVTLVVYACFCFINLFVLLNYGGLIRVDDIVSARSTSAWTEFTHLGSVEALFLEKTLTLN